MSLPTAGWERSSEVPLCNGMCPAPCAFVQCTLYKLFNGCPPCPWGESGEGAGLLLGKRSSGVQREFALETGVFISGNMLRA